MGVDYDDRLYRNYARGRRIEPAALAELTATFARYAPAARPLPVLDLGSGTGRFTPALAEEFGGPVYGVEPSERMRAIAAETAAHPAVRYLAGRAEAIPLPDGSCGLALLFLSLHHVADKAAGFAELARVVRPGGAVLIRTQLADRMPDLQWYRYFPSARAVDTAMYPTGADVRALAAAAGFGAELTDVPAGPPDTLRDSYERLRLRALSTFEHLPAAEVDAGFAAFAADAAERGDTVITPSRGHLFVLHR
jgi:SAM-dependent methyltransferase